MDYSRTLKRQNNDDGVYVDDGYWWYSPTAYAVKWAIIAGILFLTLLYFVGGYMHARRRMKRGQPPLAYHRWLVPRRQKAAFVRQHPEYANQFSFYRVQQARTQGYGYGHGNGQAYQMGVYGPPPPAYQEPEYVPAYTPAQGPNKTDPDQRYAPPAGPPPGTGPSAPPPVANPLGR